MMTPIQYTQDKHYLPDFMKDFHDCKDLFKSIDELYGMDENYLKLKSSWRDNHIYVVDFFLWFLGQHGWKLAKTKKQGVEFFDLQTTINEMKGKINKRSIENLKFIMQKKSDEHTVGNDRG